MIAVADARQMPLPDGEVALCVTSPPYFGMRTYTDLESEIGGENSPSLYLKELAAVFDEVWRVLAPSGNLFVNLGDRGAHTGRQRNFENDKARRSRVSMHQRRKLDFEGAKPSSLLAIPHRFVVQMMEAGWVYRQEIIWHKPNPIPDPSTKSRVGRAHEQVFHFQKNAKRAYHNTERFPGRSVWSMPPSQNTFGPIEEAHTAVMPVAMAVRIIEHWSKPGDIVLDPFVGSGTTPLAAKMGGRRGVGLDLSEQWADAAHRRVQDRREQDFALDAWERITRRSLFEPFAPEYEPPS